MVDYESFQKARQNGTRMTHRIDIAPFLGTVAEPIYKLKGKVRKGVPRKIEKRNVNNGNAVKQQFMVANASSLVRRMKERKGTVKSGATLLLVTFFLIQVGKMCVKVSMAEKSGSVLIVSNNLPVISKKKTYFSPNSTHS